MAKTNKEVARIIEAKDEVISELVKHIATVYEYPRSAAYRKCYECGHEELIKARPMGGFTSSIDFCTKCEAAWWDYTDHS